MGRRLRRAAADYAYILPALGVLLLVIGYPICDTIYLSFFATPPNLAMSQKRAEAVIELYHRTVVLRMRAQTRVEQAANCLLAA